MHRHNQKGVLYLGCSERSMPCEFSGLKLAVSPADSALFAISRKIDKVKINMISWSDLAILGIRLRHGEATLLECGMFFDAIFKTYSNERI